jgi:hypothetical protein
VRIAVDSARFGGLFAVKSADAHLEHVRREGQLRRAIGLLDLTALGLGAVIGTGIFVILGEAMRLRPGDRAVVRAGGRDLRLLRLVLLGACLLDPGLRQRVHLRDPR